MDTEHIMDRVPEALVEYLEAHAEDQFRRRAVVTKGGEVWQLICCTVEGFQPGQTLPPAVPVLKYEQALLFEDFLTGAECLTFAKDLHDGGTLRLGEITVERSCNPQWAATRLPLDAESDFEPHVRRIFSLRFASGGARAVTKALLSPDEKPYYPDGDEAAREWLPFIVNHGHRDGKNDQIHFLLPETRAAIDNAEFSDASTLELTIAGTEADSLRLLVKGAYWEGKFIRPIRAAVENRKAKLTVPEITQRLEYFLIDEKGTLYDFHKQDRFTRTRRKTKSSGAVDNARSQQIRAACLSGEGLHVEFKPFVDPAAGLTQAGGDSKKPKETTLKQIIRTVAAFANAEGGWIYMGIDDNCTLRGIDRELQWWAKPANGPAPEIDDELLSRYRGTLRNKIKDLIRGEVTIEVDSAYIDEKLVVCIGVRPAGDKWPVGIEDEEYHLYIRTGASNRKTAIEDLRGAAAITRQTRTNPAFYEGVGFVRPEIDAMI